MELDTSRFEGKAKEIQKTADLLYKQDLKLKEIEEFLCTNKLPSKIEKIVKIPIRYIDCSNNLKYRDATKDSEYWNSFKQSIQREGLLEKPTVHIENTKIICDRGFHRIKACSEIGWSSISCIVAPMSCDEKSFDKKFMENHQKRSNSPLVNAYWVGQKLLEENKDGRLLSYSEVSDLLGKSDKQWVARYARINSWSDEIKDYIAKYESFFPESFLFGIAKRKEMPESELLRILKGRVNGGERKKIGVRQKKNVSLISDEEIMFKLNTVLRDNVKYSKHKEVITEILHKMGLISKI